jgi:hypothetical protein
VNRSYSKSLELDLTGFSGKQFKMLCEILRSAMKQEHGYKFTKGFTDERLKKWPVVIRFKDESHRESFICNLIGIAKEEVVSKLTLKMLHPIGSNPKTFRFLKAA